MTNEELALNIKAGDKDAEIVLWENIAALVKKNARYFCSKYSWCNLNGYYEDMLQEAFIYMISAANKYKDVSEGGKTFWGYFSTYYLPQAFEDASWGGHTKKKLGEPLNHAFSLDWALNDFGTLPIDNLIDPESEYAYAEIDDMDFWESIGNLLKRIICESPDEETGKIVLFKYLNNTKLKASADYFHMSYGKYRRRYKSGLEYAKDSLLELLENDGDRYGLSEFIESISCHKSGLKAWKERQFTSTTEWLAIRQIESVSSPSREV